ncbi:unnamed protein product, partial [Protopolystoma xenopodis]
MEEQQEKEGEEEEEEDEEEEEEEKSGMCADGRGGALVCRSMNAAVRTSSGLSAEAARRPASCRMSREGEAERRAELVPPWQSAGEQAFLLPGQQIGSLAFSEHDISCRQQLALRHCLLVQQPQPQPQPQHQQHAQHQLRHQLTPEQTTHTYTSAAVRPLAQTPSLPFQPPPPPPPPSLHQASFARPTHTQTNADSPLSTDVFFSRHAGHLHGPDDHDVYSPVSSSPAKRLRRRASRRRLRPDDAAASRGRGGPADAADTDGLLPSHLDASMATAIAMATTMGVPVSDDCELATVAAVATASESTVPTVYNNRTSTAPIWAYSADTGYPATATATHFPSPRVYSNLAPASANA